VESVGVEVKLKQLLSKVKPKQALSKIWVKLRLIKHLPAKLWGWTKSGFIAATPQLLAILAAFLIGALILVITGHSPIEAYAALLRGAFGDKFGIGQTLVQATPIIFTGLSFFVAFKCGLFNIGAEGQLLVGAFAAALVGVFVSLPFVIHVPLALLIGAVFGGLWALIPAILKAKLGAHEVITTMMFSYVALYLISYLVNYPFKAPGWVGQTVPIAESAQLPRILPPTQLSASIFVAMISVVVVYYLFKKTTIGYEIRAVGLNPTAAEYGGIKVPRKIILALFISGMLAGLGGAGEILGVHRRYIDGFSPGYGWDGIAAALVGGLHPVGIVFASILFGALRSGGMVMDRATGVPYDMVIVLQALVILLVAAPMIIRYIMKKGGLKWRASKKS
jgi:simple sugar transport system permease protein